MSLWRPYFSLPGFAETDPVYAHTVPRDQAGHFPSINTGIPTQRRPLSSPKLKCEYTLWYIEILGFVARICYFWRTYQGFNLMKSLLHICRKSPYQSLATSPSILHHQSQIHLPHQQVIKSLSWKSSTVISRFCRLCPLAKKVVHSIPHYTHWLTTDILGAKLWYSERRI